jgi:hypothetical protein
MNALFALPPSLQVRLDPLMVFTARCEARAVLWAACEYDSLPDAVDPLWTSAVADGLTAALGVDRVHAVLAAIFHRGRA